MPKHESQALATREVDEPPISDIAPEIPVTDPEPEPPQERPREDQIRDRAYLRYIDRGREEGRAEEDWIAAEQELDARGN